MPPTDEERKRRARHRSARAAQPGRLACPLCQAIRTTPETLRVHAWLAHAIRTPPKGA